MQKRVTAILLAIVMVMASSGSNFLVHAASGVTVYEVPLYLQHYYEAGKKSMGNNGLNHTVRVVERNGRYTYAIQAKPMEYMSMEGELTNMFVYQTDKDSPRTESLKMSINENGCNHAFCFTRSVAKESEIHIAVWVDAMDAIANPDAYVPGAGEQNAKLTFDWSKAKKVASSIKTSQLTLMVNGTEVFSDTAPYIENGRTMVPVRFISEALGLDVGWQNATKTVTVGGSSGKMNLKIGDAKIVKSGGETVKIDAPAVVVGGRTMVPIRAIAELSGAKVNWDGATSTIKITSN